MLKRLFIFILLIFPVESNAQMETATFTDERDGKVYKTVQINNTIWFQDNLKYATSTSFYPKQTRRKFKYKKGNYYTNKVLEDLCPAGWEIPTEEDWTAYFKYRLETKEGNLLSIQVDSLQEEYLSLMYHDTSNILQLFERSNPIGLSKRGWVEGRKIRKWGTTTYWLKHTAIDDQRFHIHLRNQHYVIHRHKHHIDDVEENRRKFLVKCIRRIK